MRVERFRGYVISAEILFKSGHWHGRFIIFKHTQFVCEHVFLLSSCGMRKAQREINIQARAQVLKLMAMN